MPGQLGGLVVSLGLNSADFSTGLTKAERDAQKFAANFSNNVAIGIVKAEVAMRLFGEAAQFAIHAIPDLIEQAGHFQDLAEKTGISATGLASFSVAAKVAGTNMDEVGNFSIKLSKNLTSVGEESSKTAAGLEALHIPIKEFSNLKPEEQFERLAKALSKFSDIGGGKAASLELIAKGGAQLLPFLKELEEGTGRVNLLTAEQIKRADDFSDAAKRSSAVLNVYAQAFAIEFAPAITGFKNAITDAIKEMLGLNAQAGQLPTEAVRSFAEGAALALAHVVDVVDSLIRVYQILGEVAKRSAVTSFFTGEDRKSLSSLGGDVDAILQRATLAERVRQQFAQQRAAEAAAAVGPPAPDRPRLTPPVINTGASALLKATLAGQLKDQEHAIASEQEILNERQRFLSTYYQRDLIDLRSFYAGRAAAADEALTKTLAAFDAETAAIQAFRAKARTPQDRIEAETKLADVTARRAKVQQQAAIQGIQDFLDEAEAVKRFQTNIEQLSLKVAELRGDSVVAADFGFDLQNQKLRERIDLEKQSNDERVRGLAIAGDRFLNELKQRNHEQAELNVATRDYSNITQALGIEQGFINLQQQTGHLTELDALNKQSDLARKYIEILTARADAFQKLAESLSPGPAQDAALLQVQRMKLEIQQLAGSAEALQTKFRDIFTGATADFISSLVDGTKSLKDAFKDLEKQIVGSITKIASQNIAENLFGKSGPLGGVSSFFAGIFGGKPGEGISSLFGGASSGAGVAALGTAATASAGALVPLAAAAAAATAALSAVAASSIASSAGSFAGIAGSFGGDIFGGLATGTDNWRGGPVWVGEHGPELVNLPRGASVTPASESRRAAGLTIVQHLNVMPGASTKSANQAALQAGIAVQRALQKNG